MCRLHKIIKPISANITKILTAIQKAPPTENKKQRWLIALFIWFCIKRCKRSWTWNKASTENAELKLQIFEQLEQMAADEASPLPNTIFYFHSLKCNAHKAVQIT